MTCHDFDSDIVDLARNALSGPGAERVRLHARGCDACAARLAQERALSEALNELARDEPAARFDRVEGELLAAFAAQHAERQRPTRAPVNLRPWLAMAAVLVLAAVTWAGWTLRESGDPAETVPGVVASTAAPGAVPPVTAVAAPIPVAPPRARRTTRGVTNAARRSAATARPVLAFMPLPTAAGLPELESGRVVRVELPMAMLPAYGIDVGPDDAARVVEADVLVGQDGQPRGIRFVNADVDSRRRQ